MKFTTKASNWSLNCFYSYNEFYEISEVTKPKCINLFFDEGVFGSMIDIYLQDQNQFHSNIPICWVDFIQQNTYSIALESTCRDQG